MSGGCLHSEVQVEQVWTCPGGACTVRSKWNKFEHVRGVSAQWGPSGTSLNMSGGCLHSEVQVEQVWTYLGGVCTVRSKWNKFEHVWGVSAQWGPSGTNFEHVRGVSAQWGPSGTSLNMSGGCLHSELQVEQVWTYLGAAARTMYRGGGRGALHKSGQARALYREQRGAQGPVWWDPLSVNRLMNSGNKILLREGTLWTFLHFRGSCQNSCGI